MNRWIELDDSEVESLRVEGRDLILDFSAAYVHHSAGRPGRDPGTGWSQRISLRFKRASLDGVPRGLPDKISDGELTVGKRAGGGIELPYAGTGPALLSLVFGSTGNEIQIYGDELIVTETGEAKFVEDFD